MMDKVLLAELQDLANNWNHRAKMTFKSLNERSVYKTCATNLLNLLARNQLIEWKAVFEDAESPDPGRTAPSHNID